MLIVIVYRKRSVLLITRCAFRFIRLSRHRLVIDDLDNETAFIESDTGTEKLFYHVMRHSPGSNMLDDNFHFRIVGKASILLLKSEVRWMQVQN